LILITFGGVSVYINHLKEDQDSRQYDL